MRVRYTQCILAITKLNFHFLFLKNGFDLFFEGGIIDWP